MAFICVILVACAESTENSTESNSFQNALNSYNSQDYSLAISRFGQFINQYATSELVDDAYYYRGRAYYSLAQADYESARLDFEIILNNYNASSSNVMDSAQYWFGRSLHELANDSTDTVQSGQLYNAALSAYEQVKSIYSTSSWVDNAQYQIGKVYYDQKSYSLAINAFQLVPNYTTNQLNHVEDVAQYYVARSYHRLAFLDNGLDQTQFDAALAEYVKVDSVADPNTWKDNALYQIGRLYYDRADYYAANGQTALAKADFSTSTGYFSQVAAMNAESSQDIAQYYWGRSLHENALIDPLIDPNTNPNPTDKQKYDAKKAALDAALDQYAAVPANSIWKDNGQYQRGKVYYDGAAYYLSLSNYNDPLQPNDTAESLALQAYADAILEFAAVAGLGNQSSLDDAIYFKGRSYQRKADILVDTAFDENLSLARVEFNNLITSYPLSNWLDNAYYQIGKTYLDQNNYTQAIAAFASVVTLPLDNLHDNAYYHKGLSHYFNAISNQIAGTVPVGSSVANEYDFAISDLLQLQSNTAFANSIWRDNAYYRRGLSLYQRALLNNNDVVDLAAAQVDLDNALLFDSFLQVDEAEYVYALAQFHQILQGVPNVDYTQVDNLLSGIGGFLGVYAEYHQILVQHNQAANCNTAGEDSLASQFVQQYQTNTDADIMAMVADASTHLLTGTHNCGATQPPRALPFF